MSPRRERRRGRGSTSFRSLVDRMMRASFPEQSEKWIGDEVDSAIMINREMTGRPVTDSRVGDPRYSTSSASAGRNCVEIARLPNGTVLMRDSKNPERPPIVLSREEWSSWVDDIKNDRYDFA